MAHPILETARLYLRPFEASDLQAYQAILAQPALATWLGKREGFSPAQSKALLNRHLSHCQQYGYGPMAVCWKTSRQLVGHCGLKYRPEYQAVELLYALDPAFHGMGLATEASEAVLAFGFGQLGLKRILCFTLPHNQASRRVMEKLGFQFWKKGTHADLPHVFYQMQGTGSR